jgi:hypothetical protein
LGLGGCAATSIGAGSQGADFAAGAVSSVRVGETRVLESHVNPMVPVHLAAEGSHVAVRFAHAGRREAVAQLDPESLDLLSRQQTGRSEPPSPPPTGPTRVELDSGRFLVCWTEQSADGGRHALAQLWARDGSPVGPRLVISSPEADVFGSPRAASADGRHIVVTFTAASGDAFELRAVSLEDTHAQGHSDWMARR